MKDYLACILFIFVVNGPLCAQNNYPAAEISNEELKAKLYLPDASHGYYRATRFDWSGIIGSLVYKDHEYFGNWLKGKEHDPYLHEAVSGPAEVFAPIDYETTQPGDNFLAIGVGMLRKPDNEPYKFSKTFDVVDGGEWKYKIKEDKVEFIHELISEEGYAYIYTKTVRFVKDKPILMLEHSLKNTGQQPIETTVYDHNFFVIDDEPTGPNIVTKFPFTIEAEGLGFGEMVETQNNELLFDKTLQQGEYVFTKGIEGFGEGAEDYNIRIENKKTGAGVHITADQPLAKLVYWACPTTACPEPYIAVKAAPGEEFKWTLTYEFYTFQPDIVNGQ